MDFFEAVRARRSVRKYTDRAVPTAVMNQALDAAILAPNSSNMQTWRFYWVRSADKKRALVKACLNQGAARTAQELLVFVADVSMWPHSQRALLEFFGSDAKKELKLYYGRLMPFLYGYRWLAPLKWLSVNVRGIFVPTPRHPWSARDNDEVAIKSAALAAENFMLAVSAQGFDTCPMEGFDEYRVKSILGLSRRARVVMVVSVGERDPAGIWGNQFRLPRADVVLEV